MLLRARSRAQTNRRRWAIAIGLAAIAAAWLGKDSARHWYQQHRAARALAQARAFSARHDFENALLSVRVATETAGPNVESLRLTADILELQHQAGALGIRDTIVRLSPDSVSDRLAYVQTALRFGDTRGADTAFQRLTSVQQDTPQAEHLLAAIRLAQHRPTDAEAVLAKLADTNATDEAAIELMLLRLHQAIPSIHDTSRRGLLEALPSARPEMKATILRELVADATLRGDSVNARITAEQLTRLPEATFADWLRRLEVERRWPGLGTPNLLAEIRIHATRNPADAAQLGYWLIGVNLADSALVWLDSLPPATNRTPEVRAVCAVGLAATQQWGRLAAELRSGAWGDVQHETIDLAFETKRLAACGDPAAALASWSRALNTPRPTDLVVLVRLAALWHLGSAQRAALLRLADRLPDELWPLQQLLALAYRAGDSAVLRDGWRVWVQHHPNDRGARGDLLTITFLLDTSHPSAASLMEARRLHDADPHNPYFASALALGLWRDGSAAAGREILEQLPDADLRQGARAVYYSAMLAALGETAKAARYLPSTEVSLLPEERAILTATMERVSPRNPPPPLP